ncbi:Methionyl-tRNA formyltransferase [Borrelia duttonii CR2A]|uniref:Methionyl-tRNA formyltransferase n=1 Tax=Borrelia duttonii CR2A TaxID=1432657 RepID=W6TGR7_9SPIR|nr:Methionyl-tRNA formyltransferase [Borrelia duttonii CR2A]
MRIFFASSDGIALEVLKKISDQYDVVGVLTAPDKPSGRGLSLKVNDIKREALSRKITVLQPVVLDADVINLVKSLEPELMLVFLMVRFLNKNFWIFFQ